MKSAGCAPLGKREHRRNQVLNCQYAAGVARLICNWLELCRLLRAAAERG